MTLPIQQRYHNVLVTSSVYTRLLIKSSVQTLTDPIVWQAEEASFDMMCLPLEAYAATTYDTCLCQTLHGLNLQGNVTAVS